MAVYVDAEGLETGLPDILASPPHEGTVELVVRRPAEGEREVLEEGVLDLEQGLVGDDWRRRSSAKSADGSPDLETQVTLMNARVDVLAACGESDAIARTPTRHARSEPRPDGVDLLVDAGRGHAEAVTLALADDRAADGALVVMADCPLVTAESLDALAAAARPLALAPARDGGVNAVALRTVNGFRPLFGVPVETMVEAGRAAGLDPVPVHDPALALDVDRPEDYELLLTRSMSLVTYSPKVFIPLTKLCRDVCHYCTFAHPPRRGERAYMSADEVLGVALAVEAGCHEALFTLGDKPELRYRAARRSSPSSAARRRSSTSPHVRARPVRDRAPPPTSTRPS